MLTSLGACVWCKTLLPSHRVLLIVVDFPLWHMGISGYEVLVMSTVSPVLLGFPVVLQFTVKNQRAIHLISLAGLLAFLIKSPVMRLFTVGFAVSMSCLAWVSTWYLDRSQPAKLEARMSAWSIGLIASSIAKFAFWTSNPIWPIVNQHSGGWNKLGMLVAILSILRSTRRRPNDTGSAQSTRQAGSPILAGLGFGGLVFALHSLLSDSSTMILWVWEGYPIRGPLAVPHGAYTIFTSTLR